MVICGSESITALQPELDVIQKKPLSGSYSQLFSFVFSPLFEVDRTTCPLTTYQVYDLGTTDAYANTGMF